MTRYYYAAESTMGLSFTYDSPCWLVLAFTSKKARDDHRKAHPDTVEEVDVKTAMKIAPELRTKTPDNAWRVSVV